MASLNVATDIAASIPFSSRKYIDDIPPSQRAKLCTEIDYTIHNNEGYWQKLIDRLGFDETHSKKFKLSFQMRGSPTENLLRDCSYRMLRIRHLYQVLTEIGLVHLAEAYLKDYDTEEKLPPCPFPFSVGSFSSLRNGNSLIPFDDPQGNATAILNSKGLLWRGIDTIHFSHDVIKAGTNNFSPKMELGAGAFGKVYKVMLNNTLFACKVLKIDRENQLTTSLIETHRQHDDLRNELNYLAEYRHPNVIALYGWSLDGPDPCLIYDYMKNGSLQDRLQCLNGSDPLDWETRIKVSCGAARGLQFLHTMKQKPLIHGDIKTANILLDNSFTAKLGDFGLAREMPFNATSGSYIRLDNEHTPGTLGYLANEYIVTKKLSVQVDTYAFGVVLLELYSGRRAYDRTKKTPLLRDYMDDVFNDMENIGEEKTKDKLFRLQDPRIEKLNKDPASKFLRLALSCCHEKRKQRPRMLQTLNKLNEIERGVAMANGKEPEESIQLPTGVEESRKNTMPPMDLIKKPNNTSVTSNSTRGPVESDDHSLAGNHISGKPGAKITEKNGRPSVKPLEKQFHKMKIRSSSCSDEKENQIGLSAEAARVPKPGYPPEHMRQVMPPGLSRNQMQYAMFPHSHMSAFSGAAAMHHPYQPFNQPLSQNMGEQVFQRDILNARNQMRINESHPHDHLLYGPGPSSSQPGRHNIPNPFNLDLSKVPRLPVCSCDSCQSGQPHMSLIHTQNQWTGQIECIPGTFTSADYKTTPSYVDVGHLNCQPGPSNAFRDTIEPRDMTIDSTLQTPLTQPSSFHFQPTTPLPSDVGYADSLGSTLPPLSMNPVKESMLDKLNDGQSYTQIFPDKKRKPTEGSSDDTFSK